MLNEAVGRIRGKRVLIAPLDWGLGHATRCVPIINALLKSDKQVLLASSGNSLTFLQKEFPALEVVPLPSMSVRYSSGRSQVGAMLCQLPYILWQIVKEHAALKRIVEQYDIHTVISDNRFGLWHRGVEAIYITHQIMIKMPRRLRFFEPLAYRLHGWFIRHYDECWVPDCAGEGNLSGDLSHKYSLPQNAIFVGWLSRFVRCDYSVPSPYKHLAVVSGPEPQRTLFEQDMLQCLQATGEPSLLVQGRADVLTDEQHGCVRVVSHLSTGELQFLLQQTPIIYCRSGYSTLMDLAVLGRKAELFPTPGQTEQEYLATINV